MLNTYTRISFSNEGEDSKKSGLEEGLELQEEAVQILWYVVVDSPAEVAQDGSNVAPNVSHISSTHKALHIVQSCTRTYRQQEQALCVHTVLCHITHVGREGD